MMQEDNSPSLGLKTNERGREFLWFRRNVLMRLLSLALISVGVLHAPAVQSKIDKGSPCTPLVVTIEGGASSGGQGIQRLARALVPNTYGYVIVVDNNYFFDRSTLGFPSFDPADGDRFADILSKLGLWPIVIIGHSLGGSSGHSIASRIPVSLLLTLDAVSHPDDVPHPGGGAKWTNVYAKNFLFYGNSVGEDWEHEPNADKNHGLRFTRHYHVIKMFNRAASDVYRVIRTCTHESVRTDRLNKDVYRNLCAHDGVRCFRGGSLDEEVPWGRFGRHRIPPGSLTVMCLRLQRTCYSARDVEARCLHGTPAQGDRIHRRWLS